MIGRMVLPEASARCVLIVDDDVATIRSIHALLASQAQEVCFSTNGPDALRIAFERVPDVILLDAEMEQMDGFEVCRRLKASPITADIPVIFITGHEDERYEVRALEEGAADFVTKPVNPARLRARLSTQLRLKHLTDRLREAAMLDGLTGVASRRAFDDRLSVEWRRAWRGRHPLSLVLVDVDHFKRFNDHYGHVEGDRVLREVAETLQGSAQRPGDLIARYGGEEFAVLLPETHAVGAGLLGARMCGAVTSRGLPHAASPTAPLVTVSAGVVTFAPVGPERAEAPPPAVRLVACADRALYAAKNQGRARSVATLIHEQDVYHSPP